MESDTYEVKVCCTNCGREETIELPKGHDEGKRGFYLMHNDGPRAFCECGWTLLRYKKDGVTIEYCLNEDCPGYIGNQFYESCHPLAQAVIRKEAGHD